VFSTTSMCSGVSILPTVKKRECGLGSKTLDICPQWALADFLCALGPSAD
jgi:hypothetical protein